MRKLRFLGKQTHLEAFLFKFKYLGVIFIISVFVCNPLWALCTTILFFKPSFKFLVSLNNK